MKIPVSVRIFSCYYKWDLALSISLTSISTLLALFLTLLIMTVLCSNIPDINIPTGLIVQTIIVLVIVPLILGMSIRHKWLNFALKTTPFFSALGVIALLLVIGVGLYTNIEKFAETHRYSVIFYIMVVSLSVMGMLLAPFVPKLFRIENYQTRAISVEVGLRRFNVPASADFARCDAPETSRGRFAPFPQTGQKARQRS
ncbi:MAG: bile acid:sodium symporter [Smithellaceae bacterium]|nr:bile acid:sodium symporter [Smithellaceae bacterium]